MLIKNCQAIQKSFIDRKFNAWITSGRARLWFVTFMTFAAGHGFHLGDQAD